MHHLLAVVDHTEAAARVLRVAARWAQRAGAKLSVFMPVTAQPPEGLHLGPGLLASVEHSSQMEGEDWLADFLAKLQLEATTHVASGHSWVEAIEHEIERQQPDMVFISPEMAPKAAYWKKLLRQVACPLYVVHQDVLPQRFRVALSCLPDDAEHQVLNEALLGWAQRLVQLWQGEFWVSCALPSPLELAPMMGETYAVGYVEEEMHSTLRAGMIELLQAHGIAAEKLISGQGSVEAVLTQQQAQQAVDCLLMGTVGRRSLTAFLTGNSAEQLEKRLPCDLLILHAQDLQED